MDSYIERSLADSQLSPPCNIHIHVLARLYGEYTLFIAWSVSHLV
jgi:hypothetical protein